jgi:hypothetical protein
VSDARRTTYDDPSANGRPHSGGPYDGRPYDDRPYDDRPYDLADDVRAPSWEDAVAGPAGALVPELSPEAPPLAPDAVDGNLRRYARWQWRDFWQRRGFWMAGAALLGVWFLVRVALAERYRMVGGVGTLRPPSREEVLGISHGLFAMGGVMAALLGVGGLVARERERGLQRFLFAKPVNLVRYYLQGFAINSVGSLAVLLGAVLLAAFTAGLGIPVGTVFLGAVATYFLTAGVTFLLSTLVRFDAPVAFGWLMAGFPMVAFAENGRWWAQALQWLFPQGPAVALVKAVVPRIDSPSLADVRVAVGLAMLVAVAYGVACLAAGVAVLRRRSIST